jgi:putative tricarboxylic transport membrane protein
VERPRVSNLVFGAAFALAGILIWFETRGFPTLRDGHPGPALFPGLLSLLLAACGVALLVSGLHRPRLLAAEWRTISVPALPLLRVALVVALGILYPLLHAQVGFVPTSAALILGVTVILRANLLVALVTTAASTAIIYYAFTRGLGVPL